MSTPATEDETPADDPADDDTEGPVAADLEPYELTYYMLVNSITPIWMVMEKVDPIVESEINATVDLVMLDWGTWKSVLTPR